MFFASGNWWSFVFCPEYLRFLLCSVCALEVKLVLLFDALQLLLLFVGLLTYLEPNWILAHFPYFEK
jgi:hypothetical protein